MTGWKKDGVKVGPGKTYRPWYGALHIVSFAAFVEVVWLGGKGEIAF